MTIPTQSGFFYGTVAPEVNSTDALVDALEAQVATVTNAAAQAQASAVSAQAAESNASISEANVAGLAQQANTTLATANTTLTQAQAAISSTAASATTATQQAAASMASAQNSATSAAASLASQNASATSATNSATSAAAALASQNAAANSATASASSASAASTSQTNAKTSETNSSNSAAAALASQNAASTSATNSANSATASASSQSAAATSASNASTSAGSAATSASQAAASATLTTNQTAYLSGRNLLTNGNFDIWQRGTSFANAVGYTADRWQVFRGGGVAGATVYLAGAIATGAACSIQLVHVPGDTSTATIYLAQSMESGDVLKLQGKTVTFSWKVAASGGFVGLNCLAQATYGTGTDGNALSGLANQTAVPGAYKTVVMSTSTQTASVTFTVPSNATQFAVTISMTPTGTGAANGSDWALIGQCQLEIGSVATPFEVRLYGAELALCQRYYQFIGEIKFWGYGAGSGYVIGQTVPLQVRMRASPTVTTSGVSLSNASGYTIENAYLDGVVLYGTASAAGTLSVTISLGLSAEL